MHSSHASSRARILLKWPSMQIFNSCKIYDWVLTVYWLICQKRSQKYSTLPFVQITISHLLASSSCVCLCRHKAIWFICPREKILLTSSVHFLQFFIRLLKIRFVQTGKNLYDLKPSWCLRAGWMIKNTTQFLITANYYTREHVLNHNKCPTYWLTGGMHYCVSFSPI